MLEFLLLGSIDLTSTESGSPRSVLAQPKRIAILAYVALATPRGFHRRDKLLALFWPDSDDTHARRALNQAIYQLRQSLGDDALLTRGDQEISINWEKWHCDAVDLVAASRAERYDDVLQLYRGELLSGFHVPASPEFEQWLDGERAAAHKAALTAALELAARAEVNRRYAEAIVWLRKAAAIEPLNENVVERLMQLLHRAGDDPAALTEYERYAARLASELEDEPPAALAAFAESIRTASGAHRNHLTSHERKPGRRVAVFAVSAAVFVLAMLGMFARSSRSLFSKGALANGDLVLVADFRNLTADTTLGAVVTELMRVDMGQSRSVRLIAPDEVTRTLQQMERDSVHVLDHSVAREVAMREGAKAVLEGEIAPIGKGYALVATLSEPAGGSVLASFRTTAANADELIPAVERLSHSVRHRIGEKLRAVNATPPLAQVTTSSLPALREYSAAYTAWLAASASGQALPADAVAHFERAIALDTTFASAYRALAVIHLGVGRGDKKVVQWLTRAYSYRHRLPEYERAMVEGTYHRVVTRDYAKAIAAFTEAFQTASYDPWLQALPLEHLAGIYSEQGDFARAESLTLDRISRDTTATLQPKAYEYQGLLYAQLRQDKIAAAKATVRSGNRLFGEKWNGARRILLYQEDYDSAVKAWRHAKSLAGLSALLFLQGRIAEAFATVPDSVRGTRLNRQINRAQLDLYLRDEPKAAARQLSQALASAPVDSIPVASRPFVEIIALYAEAGELPLARSWLAQRQAVVADSQTTAGYQDEPEAGRFLGGVLALAEHHPDIAIREIRAAASGYPLCPTCYLPELGMAYQANGQTDSTIAVFERYTRLHPIFVQMSAGLPWAIYPVIRLRLGELYERKGDRVNAARHYTALINLWKNADPELQPYVAKARRALLRLRPDQKNGRIVTTTSE